MKRALDVIVAAGAIALLSPILALVSALVLADSGRPVFFLQERVGRGGWPFRIVKFRTMRGAPPSSGPLVTAGKDPRITRIGRVLRRYKLDELPQLFNVLAGSMSLVGPRPEVPKYVATYPDSLRAKVLSVRPGITDLASLHFFDEESVLGRAEDPEQAYIKVVLPAKLQLAARYVDSRSLWLDLHILLQTIVRIMKPNRS